MMKLNEHVNVDTTSSTLVDRFYPDEGYALYVDDEEGNKDPITGEIHCYWLNVKYQKLLNGQPYSELRAPHIWAKLIDDTMEVYGKVDSNQPATRGLNSEPVSHTYIDENGVKRPKHGVY